MIKLFLTAFTLLAGFSGTVLAAGPQDPLVIWVGSHTDAAYYTRMAARYREQVDPKVAPTVRAYGYAEMPDKLAVAIKSGVGTPDVVQLDESLFSVYLRDEVPFVDLRERIQQSGLDESLLAQRLDLFRYGQAIYGLPQSLSAVGMYYRADLFEKWNLNPAKLSTWQGVLEQGKRVRHQGGPGILGLDWSYFEILLRQRGYHVFDEQGQPALTQDAAIETLEWLVTLAEAGVGVDPDRGSIFEPTFFVGDVAHDEVMAVLGADWYGLDMIKNMSPKLAGKWRLMPLPVWAAAKSTAAARKRRTSAFSGQGLLIYKASKRVDAAWRFVHWVMTDLEANTERYVQGNAVTAFKPAWEAPQFQQPDPFFGGQHLAAEFIGLAHQLPTVHASPHKALLVNLWRESFWTTLMLGRKTPRETLEQLEAALLTGRPAQDPPSE